MAEEQSSLAALRQKEAKKSVFGEWLHKKCPFLFNYKSLFWYFWFVFLLGIGWMFYSFFFNGGTQMFAWGDYTNQFTNLCYGFWDNWHNFFKTGVFELYSSSTFFGTDNIGSNSYYGLFDPFDFWAVLWPRSWVPQSMAISACLKGVVGAFATRAYLRYLGVSEKGSRIGGVAFAFNGNLSFMAGFPVTVSACAVSPLILLGIEKVIKERKPSALIFGLMLMGMISFFFLVVFCIFGVLYALWRYFWTLKQRSLKENLWVIVFGIGGFAIGIAMCSWTLFPSLRESALSPRVSSIGAAYLNTLKSCLKDKDFSTFLHLIFEEVGENPGRELQGLIGFLYPTCGYKYLPLYMKTNGGYDSWTASLFVYTPLAIFFFGALISSIREKKWSHIFAFLACVTMVFTIFPYYFFYAFSGDGYGRWYIVLIPIIIYYACTEFDKLGKEPRWQLPTASLIELCLTVIAWILVVQVLQDKTFDSPNALTYYPEAFLVPSADRGMSLKWVVYYQIALVVIESVIMAYFRDKEYFWKIVIAFVSLETIVAGNLAFLYGGITQYETDFNGGTTSVANQRDAITKLQAYDDGDYRIYSDSETGSNMSNALGYNGARTFHSLYNYGLADFLRNSHVMPCEYYESQTYGGSRRLGSHWSGQYNNKRMAFDTATGYKYYMIKNDGYSNWNADLDDDPTNDGFSYNIPFGAKCVVHTDEYKIYENPYAPLLGYGVDSVFQLGDETVKSETSPNFTYYYNNGSYDEIQGNEATNLLAAIIDDKMVSTLPEGISLSSSTGHGRMPTELTQIYFSVKKYTTVDGFGFNPDDPGKFFDSEMGVNSTYVTAGPESISFSSSSTYEGDDDKIVLSPSSGAKYFNSEAGGAYFEMSIAPGPYEQLFQSTLSSATRVYFIGDTFEDDGVTVKQSNACLAYEYHAIDNIQNGEIGRGNYNNLYGFYAAGKVKHIVFCAMNKGQYYHMPESTPHLYVMDKSKVDERYKRLFDKEHYVTDVTHTTDRFTCQTHFSTSKFVCTHIGYDAGWSVTATLADGTKQKLTTYRLDGGLVGFIAPAGEVSYVIQYQTPYLKTGLLLATAGLVIYLGYEIYVFIRNVKKTQKELGIDYYLRETTTSKKKKEDSTPPSSSVSV
jgi:hypothetical protein